MPSPPMDVPFKVLFAKNFITNHFQVFHFIVIYADKNNPFFRQQSPRQQQSGKHHGTPFRVEPPVGIRIYPPMFPSLPRRPGLRLIIFCRFFKRIVINKIIPRIIRRIYINQLDTFQITFLQQFQRLQVIPFNINISGLFPIDAFIQLRTQHFFDWCIGIYHRLFFPYP